MIKADHLSLTRLLWKYCLFQWNYLEFTDIVLYFIKFCKVPNNISIFVKQLYFWSVSEIILQYYGTRVEIDLSKLWTLLSQSRLLLRIFHSALRQPLGGKHIYHIKLDASCTTLSICVLHITAIFQIWKNQPKDCITF